MVNPFTGLHSGNGCGQRADRPQQLRGTPLWSFGASGSVVAFLPDTNNGGARRWQGTVAPNGELNLLAATPGPGPDTAFGRARFTTQGDLVVGLVICGLSTGWEQWEFTLRPYTTYGIAGQ